MKSKPVIVEGKPYDGPALARKLGIVPWPIVRMRLNRGWMPEDAFRVPVRRSCDPVPDDAYKAAFHDSERIRHEAAAQHHRERRDAALRRIDEAEGKQVRRVAMAQQQAE